MTRPPEIEYVRGAVAYLKQSLLKRLTDAGDSWDKKYERDVQAQDILIAHAEGSLANHDREEAKEDRVERGILELLCELCEAEIPEDSEYGFDHEDAVYVCEKCAADAPAIDLDATFVVTDAGIEALSEPTSDAADEPDFEVLPDDGTDTDERAA